MSNSCPWCRRGYNDCGWCQSALMVQSNGIGPTEEPWASFRRECDAIAITLMHEPSEAEQIAAWLSAMSAPNEDVAKLRDDLADAIRAGHWRKP